MNNRLNQAALALVIILFVLMTAVWVMNAVAYMNKKSTRAAITPPSCDPGARDVNAVPPTPVAGVSTGYDPVAANYGLNMFVEGAQKYFVGEQPQAFPGTETVAIISGVNAPDATTPKEKRLQNIAWVVKRRGKKGQPDQVWVVFRGTQSDPDMKFNANVLQVPWDSVRYPGVMVHQGYNTALSEIKQDLYDALNKAIVDKENTVVYVTGLSLGGALSTVAAADLATRSNLGLKDVRLYAFSPPRVGNQKFVDMMKGAVSDAYSLVNAQDVIPTIPPASLGYAPMPALTFSANWGDATNNHLAAVQFAHLDRVVQPCPVVKPPQPAPAN